MTAEDVKKLLGLQPHPREGGWYVRTYEATEKIAASTFEDKRYAGARLTGDGDLLSAGAGDVQRDAPAEVG